MAASVDANDTTNGLRNYTTPRDAYVKATTASDLPLPAKRDLSTNPDRETHG